MKRDVKFEYKKVQHVSRSTVLSTLQAEAAVLKARMQNLLVMLEEYEQSADRWRSPFNHDRTTSSDR